MTVFTKVRRKIKEKVFQATDVYRTPLLPGFDLSLAKMFEVTERWSRK
jgi:hypothetical protein